ncbi:MAG: hypothetical protein ACRC0L_05400, partial [Angustibacter sp.]
MPAQQLSDHLAAIQTALKALDDAHDGARRGADRSSLGMAEPDPLREPGWFRIRGRLKMWQREQLAEAQLHSGPGPQAIVYDVLGVELQDDQAHVRVAANAPRRPMPVTAPSAGLRESLTGAREILT